MRQRRDEESAAVSPPPTKRPRLTAASVPMLHSILSQLPLKPPAQQEQQPEGGIKVEEGEWGDTWEQRLGMSGLSSLLQSPNHQLASLLTAAAKLKQVAEKAMRK